MPRHFGLSHLQPGILVKRKRRKLNSYDWHEIAIFVGLVVFVVALLA